MFSSATLDLSPAAAPLKQFDLLDLSQRAGALQLMPENGANTFRLELACSALLTLVDGPGRDQISDSRWRAWLRSGPLGDSRIRLLEDPPSNPFTETIAFHGGSYTVLPGTAEHAVSHLRILLQSIYLGDSGESRLSDQFVGSVRALTLAILSLSHKCALTAELARGEVGETVPSEEMVQPGSDRLTRLREAVTFPLAELEALLSRAGANVEDLAPLVVDAGSNPPSTVNTADLPVYYRPILRVEDSFVLLAPSSLVAALTHAILSMAHESGDLPVLAERLRGTWFESADRALELLGCDLASGPQSSEDPTLPAVRALYHIDTDKVLALILLTDPFDSFDPASINGEWSSVDLSERAWAEILRIEEMLAALTTPPNGLLALVAVESLGRRFAVGLSDFRYAKPLPLSVNDLEVIAHTEGGNPLLLWQYVNASDRMRDDAAVFCSDPLDEFAFWRSNGFTYYASDEANPISVLIAPGTATELRSEARDALDLHALPAPTGPGVVEVTRRFPNQDIPIYVPRAEAVPVLSMAVDGLPLTLWIQAARRLEDRRFGGLVLSLVDFVAHWIWQFEEHLEETLERLATRFARLVIRVDLVESDAWFGEGPSSGEPLAVKLDESGSLTVTFLEGAAAHFEGSDNAGEREIVRAMLELLHDFGRDIAMANGRVSDEGITQALESIAPLGLKKKVLFLEGEAATYLDESELLPYRPLQPTATEEWRDSEHELLDPLDLSPGVIPSDRRVATLNQLVAKGYQRFEQLIAALSPRGLMENLVANGERLIWLEEHQRRLTPTRLACYSTVPKMVEELKQDGSTLAATAIAHRFVTEYVAAQPPNGIRPFSLQAYDELIALAVLIVHWGRQSDALHYGLADTELSVLESGRLGSLEPAFVEALDDYSERAYTEQIARSSSAFASMVRDPSEPVRQPLISIEELDRATGAEFGLSTTEVARFIQTLIDIGSEQRGPAKHLAEAEVRERLSVELGWTRDQMDTAFRLLSLGPREAYLQPPPGFEQRDLYPWAFSRRMSHLSRPILLKEGNDGSREALWGARALTRTNEYLFRQIVEGRLVATSDELRSLQGRTANLLGEMFNDRVADLYETAEGLIVRRRVRRIGGRRIQRKPGEPLGDIDVLVADRLSRSLSLVETKNFSTARTPAEFASEERKLRETLKIHCERCEWVEENLGVTLEGLGISNGDVKAWRVEQLVVVSSEAFTPGLRDFPVPIKSLSTLRTEVGGAVHNMRP